MLSVPDIYNAYEWNTGSTDYEIEISFPDEYWLKVSTGNCSITDYIEIAYYNVCPGTTEIPNGFTPNGDGHNDTWAIENCDGCKVLIFNRWGDEVYKSNSYQNDWDGGKSPSGAYYYTVWFLSGEIKNGAVNLLR